MRDLLLDLDPALGRRRAIEVALRARIRSGALPAGSPLPSSRALAADLGLARATVVAAYEQLAIEGYVVSRRGSGTAVAAGVPMGRRPSAVDPVDGDLRGRSRSLITADFRPGEPDGSQFPRSAWLASTRRVLRELSDARLGYGHPWGEPELRSSLSAYLGRSRMVEAEADHVRVSLGFGAALATICPMLASIGIDRVAIEDPALFLSRTTIERSGSTPVPIPVDDEGIDVEVLRHSGVRAVVVTPAHQYPLGVTMSPARRSDLLTWAAEVGGWIVEDDYDGEFRYDRHPVGALQGRDPDRVIYVGTVSKMLVPAVRLGWIVAPAALRPRLDAARALLGTGSVIEQLALADLLERGEVERHLRRVRAAYRSRRRRLVDALGRLDGLRLPAADAGLHLLVGLAEEADERAVIGRAESAGVALLGLGPHWAEPIGRPPALVLGSTRVPEHGFDEALERLVEVLRR